MIYRFITQRGPILPPGVMLSHYKPVKIKFKMYPLVTSQVGVCTEMYDGWISLQVDRTNW